MKSHNLQPLKKLNNEVFVVVRDNRRIEWRNYKSKSAAYKRAKRLKQVLQQHKDPFVHRVWVRTTNKPWKIK